MGEREDELYEMDLMTHGWPENGPGRVDIETLYQSFKARLMREVVAQIQHRSISGCESFTENIELVALRSGEREGG